MSKDEALEKFCAPGMYSGRMLSGSKSGYDRRYPDHIVVFNANICTEEHGKIWYGDLDLTIDDQKLLQLTADLETDIYILSEMDARFENEYSPKLEKAVARFHYSNGAVTRDVHRTPRS